MNTIRIIEFNNNGFNYSKELMISYTAKAHTDKEIIKYFNNIERPYILTNDEEMLKRIMPVEFTSILLA